MNLSKSFATTEEYFESCVLFFKKYEFLISVPNTHILLENVLDYIDIEGLEDLDLNQKGLDIETMRHKNKFLDEFLTEIDKLVGDCEDADDAEVNVNFDAPMSVKKKYEVGRLTEEVQSLCKEYGCDTVVDIGSGLGYLDQRFHEVTGLNVLGVECDAGHLARARERQRVYHQRSRGAVVYVQHTVDAESGKDIEGFLKDNFKSHGPVCITGLHACGDLTVDGINIFLKMREARTLILMPCCYHKMKQEGNRFKNFPLSPQLKQLFDKHQAYDVFGVPFLRVAAHPPWGSRELPQMVFSLLARAVLQLYAAKSVPFLSVVSTGPVFSLLARTVLQHYATNNNYILRKNKRKPIKMCSSFESYIRQAAAGYTLEAGEESPDCGGVAFDLDQLRSTWASLPPSVFTRAALYVHLQLRAQAASEALVLRDRAARARAAGARAARMRLLRGERAAKGWALLAVKGTG